MLSHVYSVPVRDVDPVTTGEEHRRLSSQSVEMTREPVPSALHTGLLEGAESFPQKESSILRFFSQEELEAGGPARFQQDLKD